MMILSPWGNRIHEEHWTDTVLINYLISYVRLWKKSEHWQQRLMVTMRRGVFSVKASQNHNGQKWHLSLLSIKFLAGKERRCSSASHMELKQHFYEPATQNIWCGDHKSSSFKGLCMSSGLSVEGIKIKPDSEYKYMGRFHQGRRAEVPISC